MRTQSLTGAMLLLATGLFLLQGCGKKEAKAKRPAQPGSAGRIVTIQGSTTVFPIVQRCVEEFSKRHRGVKISVRAGGSGVGIAALLDGAVDIAMSSRPMKPSELERAKARGIKPVAHVIAYDALAVIVHPTNPVGRLTLQQLRDIYMGKIRNWRQVGGKNREIVVVSRDTTSGTFEVWREKVLKGAKLYTGALMLPSNQAVMTTVMKTPDAIGYVGLGYVRKGVKPLAVGVKRGGRRVYVLPSERAAREGLYPIARPLYLYTNGAPRGWAGKFVEFVKSEEGQRIVREVGFIPLQQAL